MEDPCITLTAFNGTVVVPKRVASSSGMVRAMLEDLGVADGDACPIPLEIVVKSKPLCVEALDTLDRLVQNMATLDATSPISDVFYWRVQILLNKALNTGRPALDNDMPAGAFVDACTKRLNASIADAAAGPSMDVMLATLHLADYFDLGAAAVAVLAADIAVLSRSPMLVADPARAERLSLATPSGMALNLLAAGELMCGASFAIDIAGAVRALAVACGVPHTDACTQAMTVAEGERDAKRPHGMCWRPKNASLDMIELSVTNLTARMKRDAGATSCVALLRTFYGSAARKPALDQLYAAVACRIPELAREPLATAGTFALLAGTSTTATDALFGWAAKNVHVRPARVFTGSNAQRVARLPVHVDRDAVAEFDFTRLPHSQWMPVCPRTLASMFGPETPLALQRRQLRRDGMWRTLLVKALIATPCDNDSRHCAEGYAGTENMLRAVCNNDDAFLEQTRIFRDPQRVRFARRLLKLLDASGVLEIGTPVFRNTMRAAEMAAIGIEGTLTRKHEGEFRLMPFNATLQDLISLRSFAMRSIVWGTLGRRLNATTSVRLLCHLADDAAHLDAGIECLRSAGGVPTAVLAEACAVLAATKNAPAFYRGRAAFAVAPRVGASVDGAVVWDIACSAACNTELRTALEWLRDDTSLPTHAQLYNVVTTLLMVRNMDDSYRLGTLRALLKRPGIPGVLFSCKGATVLRKLRAMVGSKKRLRQVINSAFSSSSSS